MNKEKKLQAKSKEFYKKFKNFDLTTGCLIEFEYTKELGPMCGIGGNTNIVLIGIYTIIDKLCKNGDLDFNDVLNALKDMNSIDENKGEPAA